MADCNINNGRLLGECLDEIAGVKTVFFMKHSFLEFTKNLAGEIATLGEASIFRFEQDEYHGQAMQEIVRGHDSLYLRQQIDLTVFYIDPDFLYTVNVLKLGQWAIFFMDYDNKIRLLGEETSLTQTTGVDQSGRGPGDSRWSNLSFMGSASNYAPFLEDFAQYPFDNFPLINVIPEYFATDDDLLINAAGDAVQINASDIVKLN